MVVVVAAVEVVEEETVTSEWRNAGWEAGVEEEDKAQVVASVAQVVASVQASPAEDVDFLTFLMTVVTAESKYHQVMTDVVFANTSDTPNLFENSSVTSNKMIVNSKDAMVAESTAAATTSGSTSLTGSGSDGMMTANAVIILMLVLWHIRH